MPFLLRTYLLPAALEDDAVALLWEGGTLGVQVVEEGETVRLEAYFPDGSDSDPLADHPDVESLPTENVEQQDWLAAWRAQATPFEVGGSFVVDPREPEEVPETAGGKRRLLSLPARAAFGVGSHESTRLAVELVEGLPLAGRDVLDVGTGTGILAFAALHLGARSAVAFDLDPAAVYAARDNAHRNRFEPLLFVGHGDTLAGGATFDWVLVNVVPELVRPEMPALAARAVEGMVLSGILLEGVGEVLQLVWKLGLTETARATAGEWVALRVERSAA
ncbi:MAG TPA: 50S ribosomal protein L11 methyltransferase [Thermoanaerobaculia bacterium]|nr:50S ribosomal protein L11 methyltransferase [Thermoanaerobaculia bacterium]